MPNIYGTGGAVSPPGAYDAMVAQGTAEWAARMAQPAPYGRYADGTPREAPGQNARANAHIPAYGGGWNAPGQAVPVTPPGGSSPVTGIAPPPVTNAPVVPQYVPPTGTPAPVTTAPPTATVQPQPVAPMNTFGGADPNQLKAPGSGTAMSPTASVPFIFNQGAPKGGAQNTDPNAPKPPGTTTPGTGTSNGGSLEDVLHTWSTSGVSPQLQGIFGELMRAVMGGTAGMQGTKLPGITPGLNADQAGGQDYYRWMANNFGQLFNPAMASQQQFLKNAQDPLANPAITGMMDDNAKRVNQSASDPGGLWSTIRSNALDAGQFGSSRQGIAEGIGAGRVADAISTGNASILNNAWNTGQTAGIQALGQTGNLASTWATPGSLLSAVGGQNYDIATNQNIDNRNATLFDYNKPTDIARLLGGLFQTGLPTGSTTHTSVNYPDFQTNPGTPGSSNAAGGAAIAAILAALFGGR